MTLNKFYLRFRQVIGITTLLIADDEILLRNLFKEVLESKGYDEIVLAKNGKEAVDKFMAMKEESLLVILDNRMPEMTGLEASREIFKHKPDAKILMMSGDEAFVKELDENARMGILLKPFMLDTFIEAVQFMLSDELLRHEKEGSYKIFSS